MRERKIVKLLVTLGVMLTLGMTVQAADKVNCTGYWCASGSDNVESVMVNGVALGSNGSVEGLTPGETAVLTVKAKEHFTFEHAFLSIDGQNGEPFQLSGIDGYTFGNFIVPSSNFMIGIEATSLQYEVVYSIDNYQKNYFYNYDTTVQVKDISEFSDAPKKEGSVFSGWKDDSDAVYMPGNTFTAEKKNTKNVKHLNAQWTTFKATHYVTASALNVRKGPGTDYELIGGLSQDRQVMILETQGEWSRIIYGSGFGWVANKYLAEIKRNQYTVSFDANGGTGTMSAMMVQEGEKLTLPKCTFNPPEGKEFDHWIAGNPGDQVDVGGNSIILAFWREKRTNPFTDISEANDFYNAVIWAYYSNPQITTGMDATHFGPFVTVTRSQAMTFLWRSQGCPEPSGTYNPFSDVSSDEYYYKSVLWAVEKGIAKGVDENHFNPKDTLSTQHIVTFLYRTKNPGKDGWNGEASDWAGNSYGGRPFGVDIVVNNTTPCPRCNVVQFLYKSK